MHLKITATAPKGQWGKTPTQHMLDMPSAGYFPAKPHLAGVLSACRYPRETNQLSVSEEMEPYPISCSTMC